MSVDHISVDSEMLLNFIDHWLLMVQIRILHFQLQQLRDKDDIKITGKGLAQTFAELFL